MIKKILHFCAIALISSGAFAQAPQAFNYQAVVRDGIGNTVENQSVGFQISILQGSPSGTSVYTETQAITTNDFGLANLEIGNGTFASGDFSSIDWANDTYFLQVEMDPAGGAAYVLMGTSQLLSVPYALHAKTVEIDSDVQTLSLSGNDLSITNGDTVDLSGVGGDDDWAVVGNDLYALPNGNLGIGTTTPQEKLTLSGIFRQEVASSGIHFHRIVDDAGNERYTTKMNYDGTSTQIEFNPLPVTGTENISVRFFRSTNSTGTKAVDFLRGNATTAGSARIGVDGMNSYFQIHGGSIGIGTSVPIAKLHVNDVGTTGLLVSSDTGNATINISGAAGLVRDLVFATGGTSRWVIRAHSNTESGGDTGSDLWIQSRTDAGSGKNIMMYFERATGEIGINTLAPTANLSVEGTANKTGGGTWAVFSDERLKKNVNPYSHGLEDIQKINPVTFQYNGKAGIKDTEKEYVGLIAQEVEKVAPYTVRKVEVADQETGEEEEYLEFDPNALTYMLINAVKELKLENEDLKARMELLERKK